jgi:hypothetical protein
MTLVTRRDIRRKALEIAGGEVAAITGSAATTITMESLAYQKSGDDTARKGQQFFMAAQAATDTARRVITSWDDSGAIATVDTMAEQPPTNGTEFAELYPRDDPGATQYDNALDRVLQETHRISEVQIPTVTGWRRFHLDTLAPWIERRRDIVDVQLRNSPNILTNSGFQNWGIGSGSGLHGWVLAGTGSTVTRVDGPYGYAAQVARSSNDATLTQTVPIPIIALYGLEISLFGRIKSSTANIAKIRINDGTDTTDTSLHDGGGDWDEFTATHTVNADAVGPLTIEGHVITSDGNATFENVVSIVGANIPEWLTLHGDQHQPTGPLRHTKQMYGPVPVIETTPLLTQGRQIVVLSRQPYFKLTADTGTGGVTDMPIDCAVSGIITKLAEQQIGKANAARWAVLHAEHKPLYDAWKRQLKEVPRVPTPVGAVIGPA